MMTFRFRSWLFCTLLLGPSVSCFPQLAFHDSVHGISWSQVEPPSSEDLEKSQLLREGLGYLMSSSGQLYEYDALRPQRWRALPTPGQGRRLKLYFALAPDDIWATVEVPEIYKELIYHWDGKSWSPVFDRNIYNSRVLYFSSAEEGWLTCDYGEIWHYWRGTWQREKTETFLHVANLIPAPDGRLFAFCRAPEQGALLRRGRHRWEVVLTGLPPNCQAFAFASPRELLIGQETPLSFSADTLSLHTLPLSNLQFLSDGTGYGISFDGRTIYALHRNTPVALVKSPLPVTEVRLWSRTFSWIVGSGGLLLMPTQGQSALFHAPAQNTTVLPPLELPVTRAYGVGVLQEAAGRPRWIYFVVTHAPNIALAADLIFPAVAPVRQKERFFDHAPALNIAGSTDYHSRHPQPVRANYDQAIATGDLNGDGRDDLLVTSMYGHPFVYFKSTRDFYYDATAHSGLKQWGSILRRPMLPQLFDADNDGDLDLFIACQYASNAFFLNDGHGRFMEVTAAAGLTTRGGGIGAYAADFDGDGRQDLYLTCVNGPNLLYRNLGPDEKGQPRFQDISARSGDACRQEIKESQGAALADYDNDGDIDLFVCNRLSCNALLQNDGSGFFTDVTVRAGLADQEQSMGAAFFDADLDGHLDLLVTNIGRDRYYRNNGDGTYREFFKNFDWNRPLNLMDASKRLGGYSSGLVTLDLNRDQTPDLIVANYDMEAMVFRNPPPRGRAALTIAVEGILSNRSAIGARVLLFETNPAGEAGRLVGQRLIESCSGYGSSPAKTAHFGVDFTTTYVARVYFPSGLVRELHGLRGGGHHLVTELSGMGASVIKAKRTLADLFLGFRSRERYLVLLLGALILFLLVKFGRKYWGVAAHEVPCLVWIFVLSFWSSLILWLARSQLVFVLRPLVIGTALTLAAMLVLRFQRMQRARPASLEMLQVRLHAFDHGSIIHQLLNRLAFYLENLQQESRLPPAACEKLLQIERNIRSLLKQEIEAILTYLYANSFALERAHVLEKNWQQFRRRLSGLQRSLQIGEMLQPALLAELRRSQEQIRTGIAELKQRLSAEYYTDVPAVIADLLQQRENSGLVLRPVPALPRARIAAADLAYVLDELVSNSLRHLDGRTPQITLELRHAYDEVHLDVCDNGAGIPPDLWEQIFKPGFTTKGGGHGGFGLFHVRQRLEKVGGKIFVAESQPGAGTTMRICLKAEI
ncbi:MAG: FG-GAP-like repeat-containing protein [candidate division KSB1 bacterium]|nr:FG-GAP-like repeat-containing protein [candidate division KSB1 bacterium]MDZ7272625.1 FG-GAP-like repeat-containing protein [candidate division KSB1 bacterium]MDZ7284352.1 FG-GAP-like repeat-containing protein [candidate division KSB1 bacterium]MDZ7297252.1 FG-GAP-like repeat-containing protein [candidate division KSB1 bacterium]MDZ7307573.1 FG-GAP-like repeat-containing protein [candidate division KSB1 bacterium]